MIFSHLSFIWILAILVVGFIAKNFIVEAALRSDKVKTYTDGHGWALVLNITSGLHALAAFGLFFLFAGLFWSIVLAVISGVVEYLIGYWAAKKRIPSITTDKLLVAYNWFSTVKSLSYTGIIATFLEYAVKAKLGS